MAEYDSAVALAKRLIEKKGRSGCQVVRPGAYTASDSSKPWATDVPVADVVLGTSVKIVFLNLREVRGQLGQLLSSDVKFKLGVQIIPDSLAPDTTALAYLVPSHVSSPPQAGDLVVTGSQRFDVLQSETLQPGSQAILYTLQLKGG
jgi:hypothetical protein